MPDLPSISIVIPAYGPTPFLRAVLDGLRAGTQQPEAIYVSHSGSEDPTDWLKEEFPEVTALHSEERLFAGAARNRAAKLVRTDAIAFCDCDTVPATDWVEQAAISLSANDNAFIVGSIGIAQPGGYWGMSVWHCEFSEQAPWRPFGEQRGGASCNLAVRTRDLETVGYFPENFRAGQDTMLFHLLRGSGKRQIFQPKMQVGHFNLDGFPHFSKHLLNQGRHFAKVRMTADMPGHRAVRFWPLSPLLGVAKCGLILKRILSGGQFMTAIRYLPGIVAGTAIWTAGCTYAAATGRFTGRY
ncbi:glycosyltransferase family A protein [Pontixanthobacter aestiaquae]|uniref:Glycosyltransferase n=1 Tax=Pontixanthobacter aestiaquae TaxID=1509367 RepID=A0A844Z5A4_9SPHN|nr:glycosyltransferase family A protein [Pontixanthobacter aestiaquae]MDN3645901.1 glycosyltransferase family A protein [Pontixanthobacter aestiaquae]MXO83105.1 glycosyltransferase [Pontixanthobacter aestiaquae]